MIIRNSALYAKPKSCMQDCPKKETRTTLLILSMFYFIVVSEPDLKSVNRKGGRDSRARLNKKRPRGGPEKWIEYDRNLADHREPIIHCLSRS